MSINRDRAGKAFLFLWIPLVLFILSFQMASHLLTMPGPANLSTIKHELLSLRKSNQNWLLIHFVYTECSCANSLLNQLVERGPHPDGEEIVVSVGDHNRLENIRAAGFGLQAARASKDGLHYGLETAPVFIVFDGENRIRYLGGYYESNYEWKASDAQMFSQLKAGEDVSALPIYGCAVSDRLKKMLDPTGIEGIILTLRRRLASIRW